MGRIVWRFHSRVVVDEIGWRNVAVGIVEMAKDGQSCYLCIASDAITKRAVVHGIDSSKELLLESFVCGQVLFPNTKTGKMLPSELGNEGFDGAVRKEGIGSRIDWRFEWIGRDCVVDSRVYSEGTWAPSPRLECTKAALALSMRLI